MKNLSKYLKLQNWRLCSIILAIVFSFFSCNISSGNIDDDSYFEFDSESGTITGYSDDGPKNVTLPSSINGVRVTAVGKNAFRGKALTNVSILTGVTTIGEGAFAENELTDILILDCVITIGESAFEDNQLETVELPDSVIIVEERAFSNNDLSSIVFGNNITNIGQEAFAINLLSSITIPNSVAVIENDAFSGNSLTSVSIGSNKTYASNIVPNFGTVYNDNGKQAGTYTVIDGTWRKQ
jgi:uncharacterized protein YejL (UPF0352 family)